MANNGKDIDIKEDFNSIHRALSDNCTVFKNEEDKQKLINKVKEFEKIAKNFTPKEKVLYEFFTYEHFFRTLGKTYRDGVGNKNNLNEFWAWEDYQIFTDKENLLGENFLYKKYPELKRVDEYFFKKFFNKYGTTIFNLCEIQSNDYWLKKIYDRNYWSLVQDNTGFNIRRKGWDENIDFYKDIWKVHDYQTHFKNDFVDYVLEEWNSKKDQFNFIETEKQLEDLFVKCCKEQGFSCVKNNAKDCKGIPDRLVTANNGNRCFVEIKKPFAEWELSKSQLRCMSDLREAGCFVEILDDPYKINDLLDWIYEECYEVCGSW